MVLSLAGCYCIYRNKENHGFPHLKSSHAWCGVGVMINCVAVGLAGALFLHPDFGMDKSNKVIRTIHKWASRCTLLAAWVTAILGVLQMVPSSSMIVPLYAFPLVVLVPLTLM